MSAEPSCSGWGGRGEAGSREPLGSAKCFVPRRCCLGAAAPRPRRDVWQGSGASRHGSCWQRLKAPEHCGRLCPGSGSRNHPTELSPRACHQPFSFPILHLHPPSSLPQEGGRPATSSATRKRSGCKNYPQVHPSMVSTDLLSLSCLIPSAQEGTRQVFTACIPKQKAGI